MPSKHSIDNKTRMELYYSIEAMKQAHYVVVKAIFEEIESQFAHEDYTGRKRSVSFVIECKPWQALKLKYGVRQTCAKTQTGRGGLDKLK